MIPVDGRHNLEESNHFERLYREMNNNPYLPPEVYMNGSLGYDTAGIIRQAQIHAQGYGASTKYQVPVEHHGFESNHQLYEEQRNEENRSRNVNQLRLEPQDSQRAALRITADTNQQMGSPPNSPTEKQIAATMPEIEPVSSALSGSVPFQTYKLNTTGQEKEIESSTEVQLHDLESSKSEYNLKDRMQVEIKLHDEKHVGGYKPHVSPIQEEKEEGLVPSLDLDGCLTQRDIDLDLPNSMRSPRESSTDLESHELQEMKTSFKPESILKERKGSAEIEIDIHPDSKSDLTYSPSKMPPKRRIRFQDLDQRNISSQKF